MTREFRADLHCHTTSSDGSATPLELLHLAKELGLSGLSITDHDSVEAYKIATPIAKELGIKLVSGVEFSTVHKYLSVHILAYAFRLSSSEIHDFCNKHRERRLKRNRDILKKLAQKGMSIEEEEIFACAYQTEPEMKHTIGRPHIAQAMIKRGFVTSIQEAFKKYLGEDRPCYAPGESFSTKETIDIIHRAGGLAIIAHPHLIEDPVILKQLIEMPFDGIECYYAKFPQEASKRWLKIAEKKRWLITGGSDFHGTIKPNIPLGASFVCESHFNALHEHFLRQEQS